MVKKTKQTNGERQVPNIIAQGTMINGDLVSEGDFRIDGKLKGKVTSSGRVVIGATGSLMGELNCLHADISGKIEGILQASELTTLKATAHFEGTLITGRLAIEPGALFHGECKMKGAEVKQAE